MSKIKIRKYFTVDPEPIEWSDRTATITSAGGKELFSQSPVRFPDFWSQNAVDITVHKYFKGPFGTDRRENSLLQVVSRVVRQIADWGVKDGYFDIADAEVFVGELSQVITRQYASFNSPVWFNCGVKDEASNGYVWDEFQVRRVYEAEHRPQCSACFITAPKDNMESILDWVKTESMIFKSGSGSGCNISNIRSSHELLSSGGTPSGPLAFMQIADQAAGSIKSGGKHRRAAKLVCMDATHPDILDFINCKAKEERKARKLIESGWSAEFNDPENAYHQVFYQNANHSISVTDTFMDLASDHKGFYGTKAVTDGHVVESLQAVDVLYATAQAAWECGDPGVQFIDNINWMHTCPESGVIRSSNPCGEYLFLDNTACNLASINLLKFLKENGTFDIEGFCRVVDLLILAQDILVDNASYPTAEIAARSHEFRTLGLGFANLGALLMACGLPYDSKDGRNLAASVASLMTARAYVRSNDLADAVCSFSQYAANVVPMQTVLKRHMINAEILLAKTEPNTVAFAIAEEAKNLWCSVPELTGFRNAQVTVIAPTGTIGFMMDCDTTGIEPELALVKYKKLVGGGQMKIVNKTVERALKTLYYGSEARIPPIEDIIKYIAETGSAEGSGVKNEHLAVFDTSFPPAGKTRCIDYTGHVKMMAAVQPFISGAISKTVNMPNTATVDDIMKVYIEAWRLGLKSVTIYRDGCKQSQPLSTKKEVRTNGLDALGETDPHGGLLATEFGHVSSHVELAIEGLKVDTSGRKWLKDHGLILESEARATARQAIQRKLPRTRPAVCHKFRIIGHTGYIQVGMYDDGAPAEVFITMAKEGSTISGLMDAFATSLSFNLQYGVPLEKLVSKFEHMRFEPAGFTDNPDVHMAESIVDYVAKFLRHQFMEPKLDLEQGEPFKVNNITEGDAAAREPWVRVAEDNAAKAARPSLDAPFCAECGTQMVRNGSCFKCLNCGGTSGCS